MWQDPFLSDRKLPVFTYPLSSKLRFRRVSESVTRPEVPELHPVSRRPHGHIPAGLAQVGVHGVELIVAAAQEVQLRRSQSAIFAEQETQQLGRPLRGELAVEHIDATPLSCLHGRRPREGL